MESNLKKVTEAIEENPKYALNEIGRNLTKEIRPKIRSISTNPRHKFLAATLQFWARPREGDLIIGYKDPKKIGFLKNKDINYDDYEWKYDTGSDPIKATVLANADTITKLIGKSLAAKESRGRPNFKQEDTDS